MRSCRTASAVAFGALFGAVVIGACRESTPPEVPPVTSAKPAATEPVLSGIAADAGPSTAEPAAVTPGAPPVAAPHVASAAATFVDAATRIDLPVCSRLFLACAKGTAKVGQDSLAAGDVLVVVHPEPIELKVTGLVVQVVQPFECTATPKPAPVKTLVRARDAAELKWAGGGMRAHLDVGTKVSPDLYLGRLEGTVGVAEHVHATSTETLIAIEAAGVFTVDGKEARLGPRQIVTVPKGTKHAWKPDPGSKLIAIQVYEPPGPEQRFLGLAAAEKDAGADSGKR